jgi:hypothetical protein
MACTLTESPSDPLHRKLRQLRCLRCRFDCYRVERTSSRAGVAPAEVQRLSRRTVTPTPRNAIVLGITGSFLRLGLNPDVLKSWRLLTGSHAIIRLVAFSHHEGMVGILRTEEVGSMNSRRMIPWTLAMAYCGFLIAGGGSRSFDNNTILEAGVGAVLGFLLALLFTLRAKRKHVRHASQPLL